MQVHLLLVHAGYASLYKPVDQWIRCLNRPERRGEPATGKSRPGQLQLGVFLHHPPPATFYTERVTAAASHVFEVSDHDTSPVLTTLFFVSSGDEIDGNQLVRRQPLLVDTTKRNHWMGSYRAQCFAPKVYGDCEHWDHGQYLSRESVVMEVAHCPKCFCGHLERPYMPPQCPCGPLRSVTLVN